MDSESDILQISQAEHQPKDVADQRVDSNRESPEIKTSQKGRRGQVYQECPGTS